MLTKNPHLPGIQSQVSNSIAYRRLAGKPNPSKQLAVPSQIELNILFEVVSLKQNKHIYVNTYLSEQRH